jgi:uncharacterized membrane protein HdeD (DUF308 family)
MVLGMPLATFTFLHVLISLVGIASGLIVLARFFRNRTLGVSNAVFLITTILTSVTGFLFPFTAFGPPHIVGVISLVVLAIALFALYAGNLVVLTRLQALRDFVEYTRGGKHSGLGLSYR